MKREKLFVLSLLIFTAAYICFSCQPALGASWYKRSLSQGTENGTQPPIDDGDEEEPQQPENPSGYTEVKPFEYFNENYIYPASKFDEWVLYMTDITSTNIASYKFEPVTPWTDNGSGEYEYIGRDGKGKVIGEGQQNKTWDLKYYMYKTRKDRWAKSNHFDPNLDSEEAEKQKRFYFYRFTGKAAAGTNLDNSTFCVDTYSKFLFFYSEPATKKVIFGNTIPSDWRDYEAESSGTHTKRDKKFYEYDPVGFVREDGSVVIYNWFKAKIVDSDYSPSMKERYKYVAKAGKSGEKGRAGHSPYKYEKLKIYGSEEDDNSSNPIVWLRAKSFKNSTMAGLKWTTWLFKWSSAPADPLFSYSLKGELSYTQNETPVNKTIEFVQKNNGSNSGSAKDFHAIKTGVEIFFDSSKFFQQEIPADSKSQKLSFDMQIVKSNRKGAAGSENTLSEPFFLYEFSNPIDITYDKDTKTWKCPAVTDKEIISDGPDQPSIKISYPAFELKRRQIKDFVITLNSSKKKSSGGWDMASEGEIEVIYTIGFN
ncbi:hypothetical protein [Treponema pedis]|uniref:hypothetical protein n=1 Tax=Treponema pedis TaxID=409322 RepID=UPI00040C9DD7|nr:hypothetical protein [Treponema pedis]